MFFFLKKVNMYNFRVGDPIPITPMHEIPEVSEPILSRRSKRTIYIYIYIYVIFTLASAI